MDHQYIPIVDMGLSGPGETAEDEDRVCRDLCDALENTGFAYLRNHGVPKNKIDDLFESAGEFFNLPSDEKRRKLRMDEDFTGYTGPGMEQLDTSSYKREYRESFDIKVGQGSLESKVPGLESSVRSVYKNLEDLSRRLMKQMAKGLGLEETFFIKAHKNIMQEGNSSILRILYYPPVEQHIITRCGVHTDYGTITLLLQDAVGGLKVRNRNGDFVDAIPIADTILLNTGDLMEVWTGGKFKATEHMVPIPEDETRRKKSRYSVALFIQPDDDVDVEPVIGNKEGYEKVNSYTHLVTKLNNSYRKKSITALTGN